MKTGDIEKVEEKNHQLIEKIYANQEEKNHAIEVLKIPKIQLLKKIMTLLRLLKKTNLYLYKTKK